MLIIKRRRAKVARLIMRLSETHMARSSQQLFSFHSALQDVHRSRLLRAGFILGTCQILYQQFWGPGLIVDAGVDAVTLKFTTLKYIQATIATKVALAPYLREYPCNLIYGVPGKRSFPAQSTIPCTPLHQRLPPASSWEMH